MITEPERLVENPAHLRHLRTFSVIAKLLDAQFRVPLTRWRFGLDGILGLVPGAGDIATALVGAYGLWSPGSSARPPRFTSGWR